ncbi:type II toxin-antitoxin system VapC family toxin [Mesorhizobium xinjiangense]|uniref:type II toxin-antitoxin system VapC family toxin n=1 Tax=Mesorhizobium xinjiangense TaxID=2678685 RepID=UPI0012EE651C|nr:type II toxin-antitoxin system VapC family toxin [Mesorhizobium xinjiangense]
MRLTADTNLLVRLVVEDDEAQAKAAFRLLSTAGRVAISLPCLCELVWVLGSVYNYRADDIADAVRSVVEPGNVVADVVSVEFGLAVLAAGGDFADGVIASAGAAMGGETFVSFDRKAVAVVDKMGFSARLADTS